MSDKLRHIVLTGFMGAGKTTVAAALARQLNYSAIDLDEVIARREKRSVPALIKEDGEARFRETETLVLQQVLESEKAGVIALGGGAWTLERNRALIAAHDCFTIWLDAPFELCWQRIAASAEDNRPLASDAVSARQLYDKRRPLYALASLRINADTSRSVDDVAAEIVSALQLLKANAES